MLTGGNFCPGLYIHCMSRNIPTHTRTFGMMYCFQNVVHSQKLCCDMVSVMYLAAGFQLYSFDCDVSFKNIKTYGYYGQRVELALAPNRL